jgi:TadE-like protein
LRKLHRIARHLRSADGAEIAEAALVLPLVFMFLLGIVWFGRAFNIYSTITQAAQQGALVAARSTCATCGNTPSLDGTVTGSPGTVAGTVGSVMQASSIDPTQIPVNTNAPTPFPCANPPGACTLASNITICRNVQLNVTAGNVQAPICGAIVNFQYPFQFYLPFTSLNLQKITLTAQAQSRMEN